jgi:hypothetical protein
MIVPLVVFAGMVCERMKPAAQ